MSVTVVILQFHRQEFASRFSFIIAIMEIDCEIWILKNYISGCGVVGLVVTAFIILVNFTFCFMLCDTTFILQVTDYAIARRIVDLHCHLEESVNRVYSAEDIQRYITFARQFKPRVSVSANIWKSECSGMR